MIFLNFYVFSFPSYKNISTTSITILVPTPTIPDKSLLKKLKKKNSRQNLVLGSNPVAESYSKLKKNPD